MSKNDDQIKELLKQIEGKKTKLGNKPRASWKTNGVLKMDSSSHININTLNSVGKIVDTVSKILLEKGLRDEACKLLNVSAPDLLWNGFTFDDWLHDFKIRSSMLSWDVEKKKLTALEKKLKDLRSEDAKTQDSLSDIVAELSV